MIARASFSRLRTSLLLVGLVSCASQRKGAQDEFDHLSNDFVAAHLARHPVLATQLGEHRHDEALEDLTPQGIAETLAEITRFEQRFDRIEARTLDTQRSLDLDYAKRILRAQRLLLATTRPHENNPDTYSSAVTTAAFYLIKRNFAPAEQRLRSLIEREKKMPAFLAQARANLTNPPRILTEIALEQIDGNRDFFANDVTAAFADVKDESLRAEFASSNAAVIAALEEYKRFLADDLLPRSKGDFAIGEAAFREQLAGQEAIELPLTKLLEIAQRDLRDNQKRFVEVAAKIDPAKSASEVFENLSAQHPAPEQLIAETQASLDSIRQFLIEKEIISIPSSVPAIVAETPPFMRSTTSASMDTPGPFETAGANEAYYFMTLPDPASSPEEREDFMRQWYRPMISNVSVHEAYPGHYIQFLYASQFPSRLRQVFGANTNIEGWAHYCEQMMLDEGFMGDPPDFRLAQIQDALLRDARFIVGIKMHTAGMSVDEARAFFQSEAFQPAPVALSEAKRGTTDPLFGYYTLGKLMILKLRQDYVAKHPNATLREFHDAFIRLGPLPLPAIRRAMLGEVGELL